MDRADIIVKACELLQAGNTDAAPETVASQYPTPEALRTIDRARRAHAMRGSIMGLMQLATGTVVGGKVVMDGDPLPEGTVVTILAREADEKFEVPPELEADLAESIAQAKRGETISAHALIERVRRIT